MKVSGSNSFSSKSNKVNIFSATQKAKEEKAKKKAAEKKKKKEQMLKEIWEKERAKKYEKQLRGKK